MPPEGKDFETTPATKRDLADVKEEVISRIEDAKEDVLSDVRRAERTLDGRIDRLESSMNRGFADLKKLLEGPTGVVQRLEKVEERVGLQ